MFKKILHNSSSHSKVIFIFCLGLLLIGTLIRLLNLFNLGSYYDTVGTQYSWGKYQFDHGIYDFWKNYSQQFDYMPGAFFVDYICYWIASFFGGTEQQFVTIIKIFNWICDLIWVIVVYKVAIFSKRTHLISSLFASLAYVIPSVWVVTAAWGQIDSFVGILAIGALYAYFFSIQSSALKRKNFLLKLLSAFLVIIGYFVKPTSLITFPIILMLVISKKDWKYFIYLVANVLFFGLILFWIPLSANYSRVIDILGIPFGSGAAHREGATLWYLLNISADSKTILFGFGNFGLSISLVSMLLVLIFTLIPLIRFFFKLEDFNFLTLKNSLTTLKTLFTKFFKTEINFEFISLFLLLFTFIDFYFSTKMHSRYLMIGILSSILFLAQLKSKRFWKFFILVMFLNLAFFLNQIWLINTQPSIILWVEIIKNFSGVNLITLASVIYLICLALLYNESIQWIKESQK